MILNSVENLLPDLIEIAWKTADLLESYASQPRQDIGNKDNSPVTAADLAANEFIVTALKRLTGDRCGYLTEENYQPGTTPLSKEWIWIVDPLDGTKEFISGNGEYAVHIALVYQGRPELAIVILPAKAELYYAIKGKGCYLLTKEGKAELMKVSRDKKIEDLTVVVSRSHRGDKLTEILQNLPCQNQQAIGSIGGKIAAIVRQKADLYISVSGKSAPKDWDLAAPELILTEAGGKFTYGDGTYLKYNGNDISQWGFLVASNGEHHESILSLLK